MTLRAIADLSALSRLRQQPPLNSVSSSNLVAINTSRDKIGMGIKKIGAEIKLALRAIADLSALSRAAAHLGPE